MLSIQKVLFVFLQDCLKYQRSYQGGKTHFGLSKLQKATNALQTLSYLLYENKQNVMYIFLYFYLIRDADPDFFIYLIKYVSPQTPLFFFLNRYGPLLMVIDPFY